VLTYILHTHGAAEVWSGLRADEFETVFAAKRRVSRRNSDRLTFVASSIASIFTTLNVHRFTVPCTPPHRTQLTAVKVGGRYGAESPLRFWSLSPVHQCTGEE